jgi:hypothetical protein
MAYMILCMDERVEESRESERELERRRRRYGGE